jgi:CheY-like chemotaxis protein
VGKEMPVLDSMPPPARKALLFSLEQTLAAEIAAALRALNCQTTNSESATGFDVIFCPSGAPLFAAQRAFPRVPVVVVSRLPEPDEWIEVLEAGARDYVAAPFEAIQLRWVLEALAPGRSRAFAA